MARPPALGSSIAARTALPAPAATGGARSPRERASRTSLPWVALDERRLRGAVQVARHVQFVLAMKTPASRFLGLFLFCGGPSWTACTVVGEIEDLRSASAATDDIFEGGYALARGVRIQGVSLYQGIKRPLMVDGATVDGETADESSADERVKTVVPIVAGRDALVRVALDLDGTPDSSLIGRLRIDDQMVSDVTNIPNGAARDGDLESTLNFIVPGERLVPGASLDLALLRPVDGQQDNNPRARLAIPSLPIKTSPATLRVMLVPIRYTADGSEREPPLLDALVQRLRKQLLALYPVSDVVISRHAAFESNRRVTPDGQDTWSGLLDELQALRARDNPADDVYYYGAVNPAPSYEKYHESVGEWLTGLGFTPRTPTPASQVAIGLGYREVMVETAAHEIGHNHGRRHSPCDLVGEVSRDWPYKDGNINAWGYNFVSKELIDPTTPDMMGYCPNVWVSAYTYRGLFERITAVATSPAASLHGTRSIRYERVRIDGNGAAHLLSPITLSSPVLAERVTVTMESETGTKRVTGQFIPYDHLGGGIVFVRSVEQPIRSVHVELGDDQLLP
jgi:hypothetical protein